MVHVPESFSLSVYESGRKLLRRREKYKKKPAWEDMRSGLFNCIPTRYDIPLYILQNVGCSLTV